MKIEVVLVLFFFTIPTLTSGQDSRVWPDDSESILASNSFDITNYKLARQKDVEIFLDVPESIVAGNDFKVTATFRKGDLKDYSRFSQDLPLGFTATNLSSPNADFTFEDQRVRIIWLKLPAEDEVHVVYLISVHERLSGQLELGGTFAYVKEGERLFTNIESKIIKVLPNSNIDPELVVDISEFPNIMDSEEPAAPTSFVDDEPEDLFAQVIRQQPVPGADGTVNVHMLIKRPVNTEFLRIEEKIPEGYTFQAVDLNNAVVTQSGGKANIIWMKPPEEGVFTIRYQLLPITGATAGELDLEGNMTFTRDGESHVEAVRNMRVKVDAMNLDQQTELLSSGAFPENLVITETRQPANEQFEQTDDEISITESDNAEETKEGTTTVTTPVTTERTKPVSRPVASERTTRYQSVYVKTRLKKIIKIEPLEDGYGNYFRVQVGAIKKPYFARVVYAEYDILRDVKCEYIDHWHKFTIGSFKTMEEARAFKMKVLNTTPTESAFIVAYRDGVRVPLAEVL
ncbi:MAG: hypothetical protein K9J30_09290 [Bacteroidales bacterium]|nr:hypothetical protein [Bacteroidales bacterium]